MGKKNGRPGYEIISIKPTEARYVFRVLYKYDNITIDDTPFQRYVDAKDELDAYRKFMENPDG